MPPQGRPTLLAAFAHPDDEVFLAGGTMARFAQRGRVVLVCATRGEEGEISDPALATRQTLGQVRERELREACATLGVADVRFLDYRDSGMAGTPANDDPRAFARADSDDVVGRLVALLRELRPDVVLTFDETGGYGHPDHIAVHRAMTAAFDAAQDAGAFPRAGPAVQLGRLYYCGFPRGLFRGLTRTFRSDEDQGPLRDLDVDRAGIPDDAIDLRVDTSDLDDLKLRAMRAHRTQIRDEGRIDQLPEDVRRAFISTEYFQLVRGPALPAGGSGHDLMVGMERGDCPG